ncbi:MAG: hypothetical protein Q9160_005803 [Pyrenula sp. 1 TL-2023]
MSSLDNLTYSDPTSALHLSQKAPEFFKRPISSGKPFPLSLLESAESPEAWADYEKLLVACLRTGDDESAFLCLERLTQRFGAEDDRVLALKGLCREATAKNTADLEKILQEYESILDAKPMSVPILKRRIAIKRAMSKFSDAIVALVEFIESSPTDAEAWCELADLYYAQGLLPQAIYSLEEALLITPNAWNLHARLGELQLIAAASSQEGNEVIQKHFSNSIQRFCRSIELCDDYLRGYYGLILATNRLLKMGPLTKSNVSLSNVENLKKRSTNKLRSILEARTSQFGPNDLKQAELIAARELLDRQDR